MSRTYISEALRQQVIERAGGFCEYCRAPRDIGSDLFAIEHIVPEASGGATHEANLALACSGCNVFKGKATTAQDPATGDTVPLFHPRDQVWRDHFLWSEDFLRVVGITAAGRATVARLRMNRSQVIGLREVLVAFGVHPPDIP